VFGRPAVRVDAVEDVPGVVVDRAQCANDSEALVSGRLDSRHALVERALDQQPTSLAFSTHAQSTACRFMGCSHFILLAVGYDEME